MNKIGLILIFALLTLVGNGVYAHTYKEQSVLSSGHFVKIRISAEGIYKLTYEEILEMGISPAHIRIYGYGGGMLSQDFSKRRIDDLPAVPFYMNKGNDGVFGEGDFILFYATGPVSWTYTGSRFRHTRNPYSNYGYYFLSDNAGEQQTIAVAGYEVSASATYEATTYNNYQVHEEDLLNLIDTENGTAGGGREFYGETFSQTNKSQSFSYYFPNIVASKNMIAYVDVAATSNVASNFVVNVADTSCMINIATIEVSDFYTKANVGSKLIKKRPTNNSTQTISIQYSAPQQASIGYLNYAECEAVCQLRIDKYPFYFSNVEHYYENKLSRFKVLGGSISTQIWNISKADSIYQVATEWRGDSICFVANSNGAERFVAIDPNNGYYPSPEYVGEVSNQNLHSLHDIDLVIITPSDFCDAAQALATAHEQYDEMKVAVVTDVQVYNEYSSGNPDATAYRWLMKMLRDRAMMEGSSDHAPRYLLLMGDGSFDNRKILKTSPTPILLTYQAKNSTVETKAYATDDYFGFLDDEEGENDLQGRMDIGIGRLPVNNSEEAWAIVNKLIRYIANQNQGKWRQQLLFMADDGDSNLHTATTDKAAENVREKNLDFVVNKLYLDAYNQTVTASGESYPLAKNRMDNLLHNGVLLFDYAGHGGYNNITSEKLLTAGDIQAMTNTNQGLWMFASCSFSHFDEKLTSAGEYALLNGNGGAIGVLSACRTVYATQNTIINNYFCDTLFARQNNKYTMRIGDAVRCSKNQTGADENKLSYIYLGDPAIRLAYPTDYNVVSTAFPDTMSALSSHVLYGEIQNNEGDLHGEFNGTVNVTIYDKMQTITTLDNDQSDPERKKTYTYNDYPNILFSGMAEVKGGKFSFAMMVPKDIKYNYGNGRIVFYAQDTLTREEGIGHEHNFAIGGSSNVIINDTIGPDINIYINSPAFQSGGKTHETPRLYANLYDEHGINTIGSGIGHDILLVIDNDPKQNYVLNDYFIATEGSFKKGNINYLLSELKEGSHTLFFRAWDLVNNSSSETIEFEVVKGLNPTIFSAIIYPNPTKEGDNINVQIIHDRPDDILETTFQLYDLRGQQVANMTQQGTFPISLNTKDYNLSAGLYIYKVLLKTEETESSSTTGKLIIIK